MLGSFLSVLSNLSNTYLYIFTKTSHLKIDLKVFALHFELENCAPSINLGCHSELCGRVERCPVVRDVFRIRKINSPHYVCRKISKSVYCMLGCTLT